MSDAMLPSAPVDAFTEPPEGDRRVFGLSPRGRRWASAFGLLVGVVLPSLSLLFDEIGSTLTCSQAERVCIVVEERLFDSGERRIAFDDIAHVTTSLEKHTTQERGRSGVVFTGNAMLVFELKDGSRVYASLAAAPAALRSNEVAGLIRGSGNQTLEVRTSASLTELWSLGVFFLLGLFILAWTRWVTVVEHDSTSGMVIVEKRYWPLLKRSALRTRITNIKDVIVGTGELHPVRVGLADGSSVVVGRYMSSLRAAEVREAIARFVARDKER